VAIATGAPDVAAQDVRIRYDWQCIAKQRLDDGFRERTLGIRVTNRRNRMPRVYLGEKTARVLG
jgi:hypothetical protein